MDIYKLLFFFIAIAAGAATGVALEWKARRDRRARARARELNAELKQWENEGGTLAPAPEASRAP